VAAKGVSPAEIAAIGLANQRETTVLWERSTGKALHNAIVWQDRRTTDVCRILKENGHEPLVTARTGLVIDPYSRRPNCDGCSIMFRTPGGGRTNLPSARSTVGSSSASPVATFTATDVTNASRTMLLDLRTLDWCDELLALFDVPRVVLPEVRDSAGDFGNATEDLLGARIPICGVAGDQQAANVRTGLFWRRATSRPLTDRLLRAGEHRYRRPASRNRCLKSSVPRPGNDS